MPIAPVSKLKKSEIVWLANHYCKHSHTYLEHYNCYLAEVVKNPLFQKKRGEDIPMSQTIGYFDIESSNLKANFGIMFCYCIKDSESNKIYERLITKKEIETCLDKKVVQQCIKDLKRFDKIVTYYGTRFDLPFVRTRALYHKIPFPFYKELLHTDVYYMVRNKFCLHRNRLEVAYNALIGDSKKTHFNEAWLKAMTGNKKALKYILSHCRIDVRELEELHKTVENFTMRSDRSI